MAESDFQTEFSRGFETLVGCHYHKIPDTPSFLQKKQKQAGKVVIKNPYDCYALHMGLYLAMELKQPNGMSLRTQSPTSEGLTPEQEDELTSVAINGGAGLVVCNFLIALSKKQQEARAGQVVYDKSFAVSIIRLTAARRETAKDAIPLEWWEKNAVELPFVKVPGNKSYWDPLPLLIYAHALPGPEAV